MRHFLGSNLGLEEAEKFKRTISWLPIGWLLIGLLVFTLPANTQAAGPDGTVDPTFKSGSGPSGDVVAITTQPDGKILVGGNFTTYNDKVASSIVRLNADSSLDSSFNSGSGFNKGVFALTLQSDNKILVGGDFTSYNGTPVNRIARLNPDGSLDASFNAGSDTNNRIYTIDVLNSDKILVGGSFTIFNGINRNALVLLNPDGSLDAVFDTGFGSSSTIYTTAVQNDSKILLGGRFTISNTTIKNIARLNTDGSLDSSFVSNIDPNFLQRKIALQNDGKILLGGVSQSGPSAGKGHIIRLNVEGSVDNSFNSGTNIDNDVTTIIAQNDGKITIGGYFTSYNGIPVKQIARLHPDGSIDNSFNSGLSPNNPHIYTAIMQNNGKIIIGGRFIAYNNTGVNRLARLQSDGSLDTSFNNQGTGADWSVRAIATQNNGKIIISGFFTRYNGKAVNRVARLNPDGSLDTSFNSVSEANDAIYAMGLQTDGKVIIGGAFTIYNGKLVNRIARLNADGSLDTSFNVGSGADSDVNIIVVQSDGKIIIGGAFYRYNNIVVSRVARLNPDGSLDTSFNSGTGVNGSVQTVKLQSDDKILIAGGFSTYNGTSVNQLIQLNPDGTLDNSFNFATPLDFAIYSIALQNDSKIIIGGVQSNLGTFGPRIARLNPNGTLDNSFTPADANFEIRSLAIQSDGKIIIGGYIFNNYPLKGKIIRLNTDGSLDTFFDNIVIRSTDVFPPDDSAIYATALLNDSKIIIGGKFKSINNYTRDNLARLKISNKPTPNVTLTATPNPAAFGENITFTAAMEPTTATGTVRFYFGDGSTSITSTLSNGIATYVTNTLPRGNTPVWVVYNGDENFMPNISQIYAQSVNKLSSSISVTSSLNPAILGENVTFTATLARSAPGPQPPFTGIITFSLNGSTIPLTVINGAASYVTNTLAIGSHPVTASYSGDSNYDPANSAVYTQVISCNPLSVSSSSDDGQASTCGSFSYALVSANSGTTISFNLPNGLNKINLSGPLTPTLKAGVAINGGANGVILDGNGASGDGLRLSGSNSLTNLTIRGFSGRELVASGGATSNWLYRVRIEN